MNAIGLKGRGRKTAHQMEVWRAIDGHGLREGDQDLGEVLLIPHRDDSGRKERKELRNMNNNDS